MARKTVCNKCGKTFDIWDEYEGISVRRVFGYGTKYDGCDIELDLCSSCVEELIDGCKINPVLSEPGICLVAAE